jgi:DNA repair photolyase
MYEFVTHTWNPVKGCRHDCEYCYLRAMPYFDMTPRISENEFSTNLGKGNTIFIGSSSDMWGEWVPKEWIERVLEHCNKYQRNTYLFQTKNPKRFHDFQNFPESSIICTTIESNKDYNVISKAPAVTERQQWIGQGHKQNLKRAVTIEPVLDFDLDVFTGWMKDIAPDFITIGADSKNHGLPEPTTEKLEAFIHSIKTFTKVVQKRNLARLLQNDTTERVK